MPVRSFYIRDLLEDGGGGGGEQNGGLVVDDVVVVIESPVRASADAGKELVVSEVPVPIYIRSDAKLEQSWPPKRRIRTVFSGAQIASLEERFQSQHYLTAAERTQLAARLDLSPMQIKTWFQNRRMKWKKTCR